MHDPHAHLGVDDASAPIQPVGKRAATSDWHKETVVAFPRESGDEPQFIPFDVACTGVDGVTFAHFLRAEDNPGDEINMSADLAGSPWSFATRTSA